MSKVCLVIIYNHNYEKNIPVLNRIYAGRFSHIYHVMPFYTGDNPNVIGVYESSYQFSGYISQAAGRFESSEYSHYIFVADDMVINPSLDENNILDALNLKADDAFISDCNVLRDQEFVTWLPALPSVMNLEGQANACEWKRFMPRVEDARAIFESHGLNWHTGVSRRLYNIVRCGCRIMRKTPFYYGFVPPFGLIRKFWKKLMSEEKTYPLAWGYSDFCVIPQSCFKKFTLYSGVLAACRVFVEVAIPTALTLACRKIRVLGDSKWSAESGVKDYSVRETLEADAGMDYRKLIENYPKDYLYIHPIKLSKWKNLP